MSVILRRANQIYNARQKARPALAAAAACREPERKHVAQRVSERKMRKTQKLSATAGDNAFAMRAWLAEKRGAC